MTSLSLPGQALLQTVATYLNDEDQELVVAALATAVAAHQGYERLNGTAYVTHAIAVAAYLATWRAPAYIVAAGLLHDVLKENYATPPPIAALNAQFGPEITSLVQEVAKLGRLGPVYPLQKSDEWLDSLDHMAERMPWAILSLQRAPLAGVVKIADRLHNFQTLYVLPRERQHAFAESVMNIFVPFANRLGMRAIKRQLEDAAFGILQPDKYAQIRLRYPTSKRQAAVQTIMQPAQQAFTEANLPVQVQVKPVSFTRLYRQQIDEQKPILMHLTHPLLIITPDTAVSYQALGVIHQLWPPEQGQVIDTMAVPKANGYRALHTRVRVDDTGSKLLVIIQEKNMHTVGELGITAGWHGIPAALLPVFAEPEKVPPGMITVFTPKRDVHILPRESTPIDFAYAVHSSMGHQCTGAFVNGRMVPLTHTLENGDVVKILTSKASVGPARDWLEIVQTRKARHYIHRWFRDQDNDLGRTMLPAEAVVVMSLSGAGLPQRIAGCCAPQPPDAIIGYINRRNIVVIHEQTCPNVQGLHPKVQAEWNTVKTAHNIELEISAVDRPGLVRDVSTVLSNRQISMTSFHADSMPDGSADIHIGLGSIAQAELGYLRQRLESVAGVRRVISQPPTRPRHWVNDSVLDRHFINPYTLNPVSGKGFYGRWEELRTLVDNLRGVQPGEAVLLWGPRRIGKTSLLLQFQQNVMSGDDYLLASIDMQRLSGRSTSAFLLEIMHAIRKILPRPRLRPPTPDRMRRDPLGYFRHYLEQEPALLDRHLVLILDEFQLLAGLAEDEVTLADVNRYFRSLIQHRTGLSIIFSGGGVLDNLLQQPAASFMLEVVRHQKIGSLDETAARELITKPVARVQFEPEVVAGLLELTARHPYYLQWICGELVSRADQEQRPFITTLHLQELLDAWIPQQGEQFFNHLWGSSIGFARQTMRQQKLILTAIATLSPPDRWVNFHHIAGSGVLTVMNEGALWRNLQNLVEMDTLRVSQEGTYYCLRMPLAERWLTEHYTVPRVIKEIQWPG